MTLRSVLLPVLLVVSASASAQAPTPATSTPADAGRVLDTAVVRVPGPGMWKVRNGGNTLWILGTVSPLPAGMAWNSAKVRGVIAQADEVIAEPSISVGADVGFFGKLALLPSLIGVRSLPDDSTLHDVLPAPVHARWLVQKQRYLGRDEGVERWRPIFAAMKLYEQAVGRAGLSARRVVEPTVADAVKARGLKTVTVGAQLKIAHPKAVIKDFKKAGFADVECFEKTLARVESDLPALAARADAWAVGDIGALRSLRNADLGDVCERAMLGGQFGEKYGIDKLEAQARAKWVAEAAASLTKHRVTFAVLPMNDVLSADGLVAALAAKGFAVEPPDALAPTTQPVAGVPRS